MLAICHSFVGMYAASGSRYSNRGWTARCTGRKLHGLDISVTTRADDTPILTLRVPQRRRDCVKARRLSNAKRLRVIAPGLPGGRHAPDGVCRLLACCHADDDSPTPSRPDTQRGILRKWRSNAHWSRRENRQAGRHPRRLPSVSRSLFGLPSLPGGICLVDDDAIRGVLPGCSGGLRRRSMEPAVLPASMAIFLPQSDGVSGRSASFRRSAQGAAFFSPKR